MTQYAKRKIDVTISLGEGRFGDDKGKDVTLSGLRVSANVVYYGNGVQAQAQIRIWGMPLSMINQLTGTGQRASEIRNNRILIAAGDEGGVMSTVYQGGIRYAYGDFQNAPEVTFNVLALGSAIEAVRPVAANSFSGSIDAAVVMGILAKLMGLTLESNGVSVMLSNPYYSGTALQQVKECAKEAGIDYSIDRGILSLRERGGYRQVASGPVKISPGTGMVGYPTFGGQGVIVRSLFNPEVIQGGQIEVTSDITVACGVWNVFNIVHSLESEIPNGQWFTEMDCSRPVHG